MSMRYLIRRPNSLDFSEVQKAVPSYSKDLGEPAENRRRFFQINYAPSQYAVYQFFTQKKDGAWAWTCPSIELVGESEKDFLALTERFQVSRETLSHLPKDM